VHLRLDLRHVEAEHHEVVGLARLILRLIAQERLAPEAQSLEHGDRAALIDCHLRDDFFLPALDG
jgi:hypothetical protein